MVVVICIDVTVAQKTMTGLNIVMSLSALYALFNITVAGKCFVIHVIILLAMFLIRVLMAYYYFCCVHIIKPFLILSSMFCRSYEKYFVLLLVFYGCYQIIVL